MKSKLVHFRVPSKNKTDHTFKLGDEILEVVDNYKYLGIKLNENLDYNFVVNELAGAATRALGSIIHKYRTLKGLGYYTYKKLYTSGVEPITDYCGGIWGFKDYYKLNTVQNRAMKIFLGVNNFTPTDAIIGDLGWTTSHMRRKLLMLKYWNRLIDMDNTRIAKIAFLADHQMCRLNWSAEVKKIVEEIGMFNEFSSLIKFNINMCWSLMTENNLKQWKCRLNTTSKLSGYKTYKDVISVEKYVIHTHNIAHRSVFAKLRAGVLPLAVETGRWRNKARDQRLCILCDRKDVEDESHFLFICNKYETERQIYFSSMEQVWPGFRNLSVENKMIAMMSDSCFNLSVKYVYNIYTKRRNAIFV